MKLSTITAALALALGATSAWAATPAAPDVAKDPKGAWDWFLAHGTTEHLNTHLGVRGQIGYSMVDADPAKCREHAAALDDAVRAVPVSLTFRRMAMLCAEATGDSARAERELQAVAALSKYALSQASDSYHAAPIRVTAWSDIGALLASMGLENRYEYYAQAKVDTDFPVVVAAWDPQAKVERHLRFDWTDTWSRLAGTEEQQYPIDRMSFVDTMLQADAKTNDVASIDELAVRAATQVDGAAARAAALRGAAEAGGSNAAWGWTLVCSLMPDAQKTCADGLVDALLPQAEKQHARAMVLLAYAYAQGLGVPADEGSAMRLLDAADQRWNRNNASVAYADLWLSAHPGKPLPTSLADRLARAVSLDNENALFVQLIDTVRRDPKFNPDAKQVAYLSSPMQNGEGAGYVWLQNAADDAADKVQWQKRAAEAGDADAQAAVAAQFLQEGGAPKPGTQARLWLERAAQNGNAWAARALSYFAASEGDGRGAEQWVIGAASAGDVEAILRLAGVWSSGMPGVNGTQQGAMDLYRELSKDYATARRSLAIALIDPASKTQDPAEARRLLQQDAEKGDHESEAILGSALLNGRLGPVDETAGTKWIERAVAANETSGISDYGFWLFYKKNTPASRTRALELWRANVARDTAIANNLAWALCTSDVAEMRDAKGGLAAVAAMGKEELLGLGQLDTIAACRAASGDYRRAAELQATVIDQWRTSMKGRPTTPAIDRQAREFERRLALYKQQKPYVELPADRE